MLGKIFAGFLGTKPHPCHATIPYHVSGKKLEADVANKARLIKLQEEDVAEKPRLIKLQEE